MIILFLAVLYLAALPQIQVHQLKICISAVYLKIRRRRADTLKTKALIQADGTDIVASHLQAQKLDAVFLCILYESAHQGASYPLIPVCLLYAEPQLRPVAHSSGQPRKTSVPYDFPVLKRSQMDGRLLLVGVLEC